MLQFNRDKRAGVQGLGKLKNFHDLSWAPNVLKSVDEVGALPGTQPGAKRVLNGVIHETLLDRKSVV